jgi:hypothetical protein
MRSYVALKRAVMAIGLASLCAGVAVADPRFPLLLYKTTTTYPQARLRLLNDGWKPYRPPGSAGCASNSCKAYPETAFCNGNALTTCVFAFRRGKDLLRVWGHDNGSLVPTGIEAHHCTSMSVNDTDGLICGGWP